MPKPQKLGIGIAIYKQNRDDDIQQNNINIRNPHSHIGYGVQDIEAVYYTT